MQRLHRGIPISGIDKPLSRLVLGTSSYKPSHREDAFRILDRFVELGGTVIDTARAYGGGESEALLGLWLEERRNRSGVVLITKCGHGKDFMLPLNDFEGMVRRELAQSLESLGTESIDLYLLHRDNPRLPVGKVLEVLNREIETGRIMAFGASNWTYHRITEANAYARKHGLKGFSTISNNISLAVPAGPFYPGLVSVDEEGEKWHRKSRVPLISWSSLARGFFTGCYTPATATSSPAGPAGSGDFTERPENAFERRMAEVYCTDENFQRLDRARQVGERKGGYTPAETALAWVLNRPYPVLAAVGPHTQEHLESCVKASHLALSADEMDYLRSGGP